MDRRRLDIVFFERQCPSVPFSTLITLLSQNISRWFLQRERFGVSLTTFNPSEFRPAVPRAEVVIGHGSRFFLPGIAARSLELLQGSFSCCVACHPNGICEKQRVVGRVSFVWSSCSGELVDCICLVSGYYLFLQLFVACTVPL